MSIAHPNLLAQAEAFYWIVRLGGFHQAALQIGITQPAVSIRIRELEAALKQSLFERTNNRAILTPEGEHLFPRVQKLLVEAQALRAPSEERDFLHGLIRVGSVESVAITSLPKIIGNIRRAIPGMRVSIVIDTAPNLALLLSTGGLDLAVLSDPEPDQSIAAISLGMFDLKWVASPALGLPRKPLTPHDLKHHPILMHAKPSRMYQVSLDWFRLANIEPDKLYCNSLTLAGRFVVEGHGAALLPPCIIADAIATGRAIVYEADPPIPKSPMFLSYGKDKLGSTLQLILGICRSEIYSSGLITEKIGTASR